MKEKAQNTTGKLTEEKVKKSLDGIGLIAEKPRHDKGIDLIVSSSAIPGKGIKIQIKGRGDRPKNGRWFQIRTSPNQRDEVIKSGLHVSEALIKKINLCDFFILVSLKHDEQWVFPKSIIHEIIKANKEKYGKRDDNQKGHQAEMNLDIADSNGDLLRDKYSFYKNNFLLIEKELRVE